MKQWIVCDLDGTLCDCSHRIDYAKASQWDDFHSRCELDKPFTDVLELLIRVTPEMKLVVLTGRTEKFREQTLRWLNKYGVLADALIMRGDTDFQKVEVMKIAYLEHFFGSKEKLLSSVAFALEDRDKVVEAFRNYGISCFQPRTGEYA